MTAKTIFDLDYHAKLRPSMVTDGTIDLMFADGFGFEDPRDEGLKPRTPEKQAAWAATKIYCLKYLERFFTDEEGAYDDLGSLSIALCMFFDGFLSATTEEVAQYN